jgi:DNA-binding LacI/PurR family transcriptional regulator
VSNVLSGRPNVSKKTRQRVLSSIQSLNYVPSAAARSLAGDRTKMIGVVISYDAHDLFADPNLMQVLHGVDEELSKREHVLLLSSARSMDDRLSAYRRLLGAYRVDGVLVESGRGEEGVAMLIEQGYACVIIGHSEVGLPSVYPDDEAGGRQMAEHLLSLGHRRIGLIAGPQESVATKLRRRGFALALAQADVSLYEGLVAYGTYSAESGYQEVERLIAQEPLPTALFCFNDRMAFGAIRRLREHGYRVPEDVSVCGFDDIEGAMQFDPSLTTVRLPARDVGRRAAGMLFDLIEDGNQEGQQTMLPVQLIVRQSTAQVPERR